RTSLVDTLTRTAPPKPNFPTIRGLLQLAYLKLREHLREGGPDHAIGFGWHEFSRRSEINHLRAARPKSSSRVKNAEKVVLQSDLPLLRSHIGAMDHRVPNLFLRAQGPGEPLPTRRGLRWWALLRRIKARSFPNIAVIDDLLKKRRRFILLWQRPSRITSLAVL